nr:MAG TPA: hypothetical protein [Caudoviricetes sp.]
MDLTPVIEEVKRRCRYDKIDDIIEKPSDLDIEDAIYDSLADINSLEPETSFSLDFILSEGDYRDNKDHRWRRVFILGACAHSLQALTYDWTHNGFDADLNNGVAVKDRLSDYKDLMSTMKQEFDTRLQALKTASQKFSRVSHFITNRNPLAGGTTYSNRVRTYYYKSTRL